MVSTLTILTIATAALVCIFLPIVLVLIFKKKVQISIKSVITGALVFVTFALVLERILHMVVINNNLITSGVLFGIYGALAAGLFEETGRFVAFKTVLRKQTQWKDGIAYGFGHGGIEAILVGGLTFAQYTIFSILINNGQFEKVLGANAAGTTLDQLLLIKKQLIELNPGSIFLGISERIIALTIHIALSMIVLYGIQNRKNIYYILSILLHALVDLPAGLFQTKVISSLYVVEALLVCCFIVALVFLIKSKPLFIGNKENLKMTGAAFTD